MREGLSSLLWDRFGGLDAVRMGPWILPAIGFHDGVLGDEPEAIGGTRFGGRPDLPEGVVWPEGPNGPLAFLGQIGLSEIVSLDVDKVLPEAGVLSFFYNIYDYAWGRDRRDQKKFAVIYTSGEMELKRRPFPEGIRSQNAVSRCRKVDPYVRWQVPTADPLAKEALGFGEMPTWGEPEADSFTRRFWDLESDLEKPHIPVGIHQLLGWANGIFQQEEDCRLMCERRYREFAMEVEKGITPEEDREKWRCLLQINDDEALYGDSWASGGTLAFMIRENDLLERNFGRCWCVLSSS